MSTPHALPLLDLSPFAADESSPEAQAFVDELREVVHTVGFLYVTGHGVDPELATRIHDVTRAFFALPEADRLEIENVNSPQFRGYTRFGHEVTNGRSTCATRSTSVARSPPEPSPPTSLNGCGSADRTCGRARCRNSATS